MPYTIQWPEIALRLLLTIVAGAVLGLNRSEHGHAAGLRTTLLVCLAASASMIQVNLLLPVALRQAEAQLAKPCGRFVSSSGRKLNRKQQSLNERTAAE